MGGSCHASGPKWGVTMSAVLVFTPDGIFCFVKVHIAGPSLGSHIGLITVMPKMTINTIKKRIKKADI